MEQESVIPQPNNNQIIPPQQQPQTPKKKRLLSIGIALIFILVLIAGSSAYFFINQKTGSPSQQHEIVNTNQAWKTYTNNYYNFKLEIPSDWKVEEQVVKGANYVDSEYQEYKLSSPNRDLIIENTSTSKNNHIKQQLPNSKVQLGEYILDRYPYINDDNQRIDYISFINIKRQKSLNFNFTISGDFEKNNQLLLKLLKTFVYTKQEPSLDDKISYVISQGWKKEDTDTSLYLSFVSSDFHEEGLPTIVTGARITINKTKKDPTKTLAQQITPNNIYDTWNIATSSATFNSIPYTNVFACAGEFGFCRDYYSADNNGNVWTITMICNKNCDTKTGIDSTIYAKDRDLFLNSIKFR